MTASVKSFRELVDMAHAGRLKLPAFQRNWRWRTDKVKRLFDSLRQRYPIGSLLFLGGEGADLSPRTFQGSVPDAQKAVTESLVLDGQQRLTAGVHLFHGTGARQYFLDLTSLRGLVAEAKLDLKNKTETQKFAASLDTEDAYLVAREAVADPRALLIDNHLLATSILADSPSLNQALLDYVKKYSDSEPLLFMLVSPYFSMTNLEPVPFVTIDAGTQLEAISRIFTTLNTTGQLLTPFELVVAILYPKGIHLVQEYRDLCQIGKYFPNMDLTGEILLQTIAMLAGADPKKANLPRTIKPEIWTQHYEAAFDALEDLGAFLTNELGAGLDVKDASLAPYDAIYAPMACVYRAFKAKKLKGTDEAAAKRKLEQWYVGSALSQRYQEGVHNKQRRDYADFMLWLDKDDATPVWLKDVQVPILNRASFEGAVGRLVQSLINSRDARDPLTNNKVGFRQGASPTEKHHLFPTKYLSTIPEWDKKQDSGDVIANLMFVERETNRTWINQNPADHITQALKGAIKEPALRGFYQAQFIEDKAFELLKKPKKAKADFLEFLELRQSTIRKFIGDRFGFPLNNVEIQEDLDEEEQIIEEGAQPAKAAAK